MPDDTLKAKIDREKGLVRPIVVAIFIQNGFCKFFQGGKAMANNIGNITQLFRGVDKSENGSPASKIRGPSSKSNGKKDVKGTGKFGDSAKVELSKEAEMYGKVVDLLQQKYDNADIFVAGSNDDISKIFVSKCA